MPEDFAKLKAKLAKRKGVRDPGALAAWIERRLSGGTKMTGYGKKGE